MGKSERRDYFGVAIDLWLIANRTHDPDDRAMYERVAGKYLSLGIRKQADSRQCLLPQGQIKTID